MSFAGSRKNRTVVFAPIALQKPLRQSHDDQPGDVVWEWDGDEWRQRVVV